VSEALAERKRMKRRTEGWIRILAEKQGEVTERIVQLRKNKILL
jgi:hypothetical protein